jgi:lysyl-tRNA synthetase class 1
MSSSKGLGLKAHDLVNILPPEVARFLFISADIKSQSNFDPAGTMAIPDLFDFYDKCWKAHDGSASKQDLTPEVEKLVRTYVLSQISSVPEKEKGFFVPRLRDVANYLSQGLNPAEILVKLEKEKNGKLDDSELNILEERMKYAKVWLENYAPDEYRFDITEVVPAKAKSLSVKQKDFLGRIHEIYDKGLGDDPESLQNNIYVLSQEVGLSGKDAFSAIYTSILGKSNGPRAGVLLSNIGKDKVLERLKEVINS